MGAVGGVATEEALFGTSTYLPLMSPGVNRRKIPRRAADRKCVLLARVAKALVNSIRQPQIIVDEQSVVLLANTAAKRFLACTDAICIREKKLQIKDEPCRAALRRVIPRRGGEVSFSAEANGRSMLVCVRSLYGSRELAEGKLLMLAVSEELCGAPHGLTKAELEIASAIHKGLSLVSISRQTWSLDQHGKNPGTLYLSEVRRAFAS